jgi:DNA-directed RNA polymerase sigma subunit (sigma70/sigma32)
VNLQERKDLEHKLIKNYQTKNCSDSLEQLFKLDYIHLFIYKLAIKEYKNFNGVVEVSDLVQACKVGLMIAIKKFNLINNYTLLTYATSWMRSEMFTLFSLSTKVHIPAYLLRGYIWSKPKERKEKYNEIHQVMLPINSEIQSGIVINEKLKRSLLNIDTTQLLFEKFHIPLEYEKSLN